MRGEEVDRLLQNLRAAPALRFFARADGLFLGAVVDMDWFFPFTVVAERNPGAD